MPRLVAASISMTSTELPERISVQASQVPQGSAAGTTSASTRNGRLTDAAGAGEDVAVRDAVLRECVEQRAGDVVLPDDVGEERGAVLAGENLVGHRQG